MLSTTIIVFLHDLLARAARAAIGAARMRSLPGRLRRHAALVTAVTSAAAEGLRKAEQYRTLTHGHDAERRLCRAELLRFIMFVKH